MKVGESLNTSNFFKYKGENAISIAGKAPEWYKGKEYKILAPKYWFFKKFKDKNDEKYLDEGFYTEQYYKEVLDKLNAKEVYDELTIIRDTGLISNNKFILSSTPCNSDFIFFYNKGKRIKLINNQHYSVEDKNITFKEDINLNNIDISVKYRVNVVLLCWEPNGEFCHRRLVADWFKKELGVEVLELD